MSLRTSAIALLAMLLCACETTKPPSTVPPQPIATSDLQWQCAALKPLPSDEELVNLTSHQLFLMYKDEWLGHQNCYLLLIYNKEKLEADIAARAASAQK